MSPEPRPFEIIDAMVRERSQRSDAQILDELLALPALADEDDSCWDDSSYLTHVAYPYLALAQITRERRLRGAVRPLLDRACYGDPGEIMRGLRHVLEAIMDPDWAALADICMDAARSGRLGTMLWAVAQLLVLDDERARPLLQQLRTSEHEEIRWRAEAAIQRLDGRNA
jgi:HEAT repeat protein